jgi:dTMP kinase
MSDTPSKRGLFVVIDGPDGTGKTTLAQALAARLQERGGVKVTHTREPYTPRLREWLSDPTVGARELLIAFAHDRDVHLREVVEPALARGEVVICDRYIGSTLAYQPLHNPQALVEALVSHVRRPDLTLILTCPTEVAMARIAARGVTGDRYDHLADLQRKVSAAYEKQAAGDPSTVVIDASVSPHVVLDTALFVVADALRQQRRLVGGPFVGGEEGLKRPHDERGGEPN